MIYIFASEHRYSFEQQRYDGSFLSLTTRFALFRGWSTDMPEKRMPRNRCNKSEAQWEKWTTLWCIWRSFASHFMKQLKFCKWWVQDKYIQLKRLLVEETSWDWKLFSMFSSILSENCKRTTSQPEKNWEFFINVINKCVLIKLKFIN